MPWEKKIYKEHSILRSTPSFFAVGLSVLLSVLGVLSVPYLVKALSDPSYVTETLTVY